MRNKLSRFSARAVEAFRRGPAMDGLQVRAAAADAHTEILVYDVIGGGFWDDGVTAADVVAALAGAAGGPVTVRINSPGGDAFEGIAIYNALQAYPGTVSVVVDGLAGSAASIIAMAGATVAMHDASLFMIHNAGTVAFGNRHDFTAQADTLAKIDATLASVYAAKTGTPAAEIAALMDAETWFTSAEAMTAGLADSVIEPPKKVKVETPAPVVAVAEPMFGTVDPARAARLRKIRTELAR